MILPPSLIPGWVPPPTQINTTSPILTGAKPTQLSPKPLEPPKTLAPDEVKRLYAEAIGRQLKARTSVLSQIEAFEPGWMTGGVHEEICHHLDGVITLVERGAKDPGACAGGPRLILQTPPGIGKTLMTGVHLLSNALGRHPDWHIIYATYNHDKACEVGRDMRQRVRDPRFGEIHTDCQLDDSAQAMDYMLTTRGGKVTFAGVDGSVLGKRAHILVVDDPFNGPKEGRSELHQKQALEFILSTARSRLHPFGAIVVIHQRWHVEDLIGRLIKMSLENPNGDQWTNCQYPMVALEDSAWRKKGDSVHKERFSNAWCERTKNSVSEWVWSAMYQQNPTLDTGMLYKREWFKFLPREKLPERLKWYVSTDFATSDNATADHSVSRPFAVDEYDNVYYDDAFHAQCTPDVAHCATFDMMQRIGTKTVFVEKGGLWNSAKGAYRRESEKRHFYPRIVEFNRTTNKAEHAEAQIAHMACGKVFFLDTPFNRNIVVPQYMSFTGERGVKEDDDIVDADYLPFLSWTEVRRPSKEDKVVEELEKLDAINRQILDNMEPAKKDTSKAWFAGDIDDCNEADEANFDKLSTFGNL